MLRAGRAPRMHSLRGNSRTGWHADSAHLGTAIVETASRTGECKYEPGTASPTRPGRSAACSGAGAAASLRTVRSGRTYASRSPAGSGFPAIPRTRRASQLWAWPGLRDDHTQSVRVLPLCTVHACVEALEQTHISDLPDMLRPAALQPRHPPRAYVIVQAVRE